MKKRTATPSEISKKSNNPLLTCILIITITSPNLLIYVIAHTYGTNKTHNRKISEPDIDKMLVDKFKDFKAPLTASSNISKYIIPDKTNQSSSSTTNSTNKKPPLTSERVTLNQKLKQYSKYEKKASTNKNEDFGGGYIPINTEASPFMSKKKSGKISLVNFNVDDNNIKTHFGPFDVNCLSFKQPNSIKDDLVKVLNIFKISYKSYTVTKINSFNA